MDRGIVLLVSGASATFQIPFINIAQYSLYLIVNYHRIIYHNIHLYIISHKLRYIICIPYQSISYHILTYYTYMIMGRKLCWVSNHLRPAMLDRSSGESSPWSHRQMWLSNDTLRCHPTWRAGNPM